MKKFIFILSVGRSGSTALQNLLNSHNRVLIRGENNNFFYYTMLANQALTRPQGPGPTKGAVPEATRPWYGINYYEEKIFRRCIKKLGVKFLLGEHKKESIDYLGFKEIRYFDFVNTQSRLGTTDKLLTDHSPNQELKLESFLLFLNKVFKRSHFILLKRNPVKICKSGWWKNTNFYKHDILKEDIKRFYVIIENILREKNLTHSIIDFESLVGKNHEKLGELFKELGIDYNHDFSERSLNHNYDHCK